MPGGGVEQILRQVGHVEIALPSTRRPDRHPLGQHMLRRPPGK